MCEVVFTNGHVSVCVLFFFKNSPWMQSQMLKLIPMFANQMRKREKDECKRVSMGEAQEVYSIFKRFFILNLY